MAGNKPPLADCERQHSLLTTAQRKRINSNITNTKQNRQTRERIRERVRSGLRDFRLLADDLEKRDRERIFDEDPFSNEYNQLDTDIARTIEFLYVGVNGQSRFRRPLTVGVSRGEVELGNIKYPGQALPRFTVYGPNYSFNKREVFEKVRKGDWHALESPDLFRFIETASGADAIDFEAIEEYVEWQEQFDEQEHVLKADETIEFGKEFLQEALASLALREEFGEEINEYIEHREEFLDWLDEQESNTENTT